MSNEKWKDWKDMAKKKFNFKDEDFTDDFIKEITSGTVAVGGMAYGGPHGFFTYEYRAKTLWLNDYNFYSEIDGTFYTDQDYGRGKCNRLEHVQTTAIHDKVWKEAIEKVEIRAKKRDFFEFMNKKIKEKNDDFIAIIQNESNSYIKNKINLKYENNNISHLIIEIKNELEKNLDSSEEKIKEILNNFNLISKDKLTNINIYLIGKTGVGKSTLVNSFLKLEEGEKAKEGYGQPITLETKMYNSNIIPWIRLYDTQGFESNGYGINQATEHAINFIKKSLLDKDPNQYIHLIWYCVTGSRFEESEKDVLIKLLNTYEDKTLPITIVYTQATKLEESKYMIEEIKKKCNEIGRNITSCAIIAKDFKYNINNEIITQKSFGLKELLEISKCRIADAVNSAFYESFKAKLLESYRKLFEQKTKNIKNSIVNERISKIGKLNLENLDDYIKTIKNNFLEIFKEIILLIILDIEDSNVEKYINYINNYIDTSVIELFKNIYSEYDKEFLKPKIEEFSTKLCSLQVEGEKKVDITIQNKKTKEDYEKDFKGEYESKSKKQIELLIFNNLYEKIGVIFVDELGKIINNAFHISLNLKKEIIDEKIKERYKNALEEIKNTIYEKME